MRQSFLSYNGLKQTFRARWRSWLDRRIPNTREQVLSHKSIFIFLSSTGLMFSALLVLMLVTAVNYKNNLIYGFTFWFFSLMLVVLNYTYRNLADLKISSTGMKTCFVGDEIQVDFSLVSENKIHKSLFFGWPDFGLNFVPVVDSEAKSLKVLYVPAERGWLSPERIRLESTYPFGIFKTWSWLSLKVEVLVYPKPIFSDIRFSLGDSGDDEIDGHVSVKKGEDFAGVRPYQQGDEFKHISWKQSAKGKGLQTKEYEQQEFATYWLSDDCLPRASLEDRISYMTGWLIQARENNLFYGMRFGGVEFEPDNSDAQFKKCMKFLALYGGKGNGGGI